LHGNRSAATEGFRPERLTKASAERREDGERNPNKGGDANAGETLQSRNDHLPLKAVEYIGASTRCTAPPAVAPRTADTHLMKAILSQQRWELTCEIDKASDPKAPSNESNDVQHLND
jgi:hypothetical protein